MGENDNINIKFLLPNGRQTIDYINDAGFLFGFCIGKAVYCRYKAGIETEEKKIEKLIKDCNWYIDSLSRRKNIVREEVVDIVKSITSKMASSRILVDGKYVFDGGRQRIDYIEDAGCLLGFCIGMAVQCRYKAGIEKESDRVDKLLKDCNWYIDCIVTRKNMERDKVVGIIKTIVSKMESDRLPVQKKEWVCSGL